MLGPSHWLYEIFLPKRVCHHFWPRLIPLAKNTLPISSLYYISGGHGVQVPTSNVINSLIGPRGIFFSQKMSKKREDNPFEM